MRIGHIVLPSSTFGHVAKLPPASSSAACRSYLDSSGHMLPEFTPPSSRPIPKMHDMRSLYWQARQQQTVKWTEYLAWAADWNQRRQRSGASFPSMSPTTQGELRPSKNNASQTSLGSFGLCHSLSRGGFIAKQARSRWAPSIENPEREVHKHRWSHNMSGFFGEKQPFGYG